MYTLLKHQRALSEEISGTSETRQNQGQRISPTSRDVGQATAFYTTLIRELKCKTFTEYTGSADGWTDKKTADRTRKCLPRDSWSGLCTKERLAEYLSDVKKYVTKGVWEVKDDAYSTLVAEDGDQSDEEGFISTTPFASPSPTPKVLPVPSFGFSSCS